MTKVLVCGSRDYWNGNRLHDILDVLHMQYNFTLVIEGEAAGADTMAREWAEAQDVPVMKFPANWKQYGRKAGPIRNKQMLVEGKPDLVVAFPFGLLSESRGTKDMVAQARKAGVEVIVVGHDIN